MIIVRFVIAHELPVYSKYRVRSTSYISVLLYAPFLDLFLYLISRSCRIEYPQYLSRETGRKYIHYTSVIQRAQITGESHAATGIKS